MKKNFKAFGGLLFFVFLMSAPLLAQDASLDSNKTSLFKWSIIIGGAVITLTAAAGGDALAGPDLAGRGGRPRPAAGRATGGLLQPGRDDL